MVQLNSCELDWQTFIADKDDLQSNGWDEILDNSMQSGNEDPLMTIKLTVKMSLFHNWLLHFSVLVIQPVFFSVLFWYVFEAQRSLPCQFIHIQHILPFASATPETCILLSSFHCSVHSLLQWIVYQKLLWCLILLGCFSSLELLLPFLIPINYPAVNQKSI